MRQFYSAGIIVYHKNNNEPIYLLLQYAHGHWDFVKGKIEPEELDKRRGASKNLDIDHGIPADDYIIGATPQTG